MFGPNAVLVGAPPAAPARPAPAPGSPPAAAIPGALLLRDALGDPGAWLAHLRDELAHETDQRTAAEQAALIDYLETVSRRDG